MSSEQLLSMQKQRQRMAQRSEQRRRLLISRAGKIGFLSKAAAVSAVPSLLCFGMGWFAITLGSHLALKAIAADHASKAAAMRPQQVSQIGLTLYDMGLRGRTMTSRP